VKIVLAPDSFKESMSASQAVAAMRRGVNSVLPGADCFGIPMADGGEGTVDAVVDALGGDYVSVTVADALGRPTAARYGFVAQRSLAVIEIAAAAGIELVAPSERDVLRASTFGVGQLILSALDRGARELVIGLGGSATNDGGAGMLTALGAVFSDATGRALPPGGAALTGLDRIDLSGLDPRLRAVRIRLACDVTAPLLGPMGASAVFGPQKGASSADVELLERALTRLLAVAQKVRGAAASDQPGAGAAGGLGFTFMGFLGANCQPGVDIVAHTVGLEDALRDADWLFTGEGRVDAQTALGKTPFGVAQLAARHGARVVVFAGRVEDDASILLNHGVDHLVAITRESTPMERALRDGERALERATEATCRSIVAAEQLSS
jgi:glycerate 2-kinase